ASEAVAIQQGLTTTCRILLWQGEDNQTCPAATYLPEHADKLRTFRDMVLGTTPEGRRLIAAYYAAAPQLIKILQKHPSIRYRALNLVRELLPIIARARRGALPQLPSDLRHRVARLLAACRPVANKETLAFLDAVEQLTIHRHEYPRRMRQLR
ncbi:MAG: hypothetical protein N3B18_06845, partial [Desulfobacterota bacterium]|nr:hypothetical protein [Thermodesulfobacteriota bacterium]